MNKRQLRSLGDMTSDTISPDVWPWWRGSPELLSHVAAVGVQAAHAPGRPQPHCRIDLAVGEDDETFISPADFRASVTPEALRHFRSIRIMIWDTGLTAVIEMRWLEVVEGRAIDGKNWRPRPRHELHWAVWPVHLAEVSLNVYGSDEPRMALVRDRMRRAIARGTPRKERRLEQTFWFNWMSMVVAFITGYSLGYLFGFQLKFKGPPPEEDEGMVENFLRLDFASMSFVVGVLVYGFLWQFVLGPWLFRIIFPSLEVAQYRKNRAWSILSLGGPIIVTIAVAGLTKFLFERS